MVDAEAFRGLTWGLPSSLPSTRPQAGGMEGVKGHQEQEEHRDGFIAVLSMKDSFAKIVWAELFLFCFFSVNSSVTF